MYYKLIMGNNTAYSSTDLITNHRIYSDYLRLGLDDGWGRQDKLENFTLLIKIADFTGTSIKGSTILDVGCGTGDLVSYLSDKQIKEYTGIDVFAPAIEKAQEKFPQNKFITGDFLKYNFRNKFDFVFCSGALTTNLKTDNYEVLKSWIPKMWQVSKKGVVFNFLFADDSESSDLFYFDQNRVLEICRTQIPDAKIATITTSAGMGNFFHEMHVFLY